MAVMNRVVVVISLFAFMLLNVWSTAVAGNELGGDFSLTDHDNRPFELQQLRGKVVLVFFGYTSCPDVCPTELGRMAKILRAFEDKSDDVQGLFVTVDPDRDSPQILKEYTAYFSKKLQGLTGSREQIDKVAKLYRVNYRIDINENNRIIVDHSSNLYVIGKQGELNTIIPFGMGVDHIVSVVQWLLDN